MKQFDHELLEQLLAEGKKEEARELLKGFFLNETPEEKVDDALLYAFINMTLSNSVESVYNDLLEEGIREAKKIQELEKKIDDVRQVEDIRKTIQDA